MSAVPEREPTVRVRAGGPAAAGLRRTLAGAGWIPVPDGPADAEVAPEGRAGFRICTAGVVDHVTGWAELTAWARSTRGGLPRRAADADVAAALRSATAVGPYFAVENGPADGWSALDPPGLAALVDSVAASLGTQERRVAASIMFQGLAARLISPVLAGLDRGVVLDLDPGATTVMSRPGTALGLRCPRPGGWLGDPDVALVGEVLLEQQLRPIVGAVAADGPVAEALLWGNVASALVGALRVLEMHTGGSPVAARVVAQLLDHGPLAATSGTAADGAFRRRSCCLFYRTSAGGYCGDCALVPAR